MTTSRPSLLARVLVVLVRVWQRTAPVRAARCRFHPSCSQYAVEALTRHGALRGGWLAVWRVLRCQPFNPGGVDHVPGHESDDPSPSVTTSSRSGTSTSTDQASRDAAVA